MTSPVLLGNTQVAEHGLGKDVQNSWGAWAGTFGVGGVVLFQHTITIRNPKGAAVYGYTTMSSYTTIFAASAQGANWVDGAFQQAWGQEFYPRASYHTAQTFEWWTGILAPGAHSIYTGLYCAGGNAIFNGGDGGVSICWEHP